MNRLLLLVLLGLFLAGSSSPALGQGETQMGGTIGLNLATVQAPNAEVGVRPSYVVGVVVRQEVYGPAALQSELLLSQKGAAVLAEEEGSIRYGAGYLDLPLLIHVTGPTVQGVTVHGEAGGFGAVKIFEQQRPGGGGLNLALSTETTFFKRFDAGGVAGLGATFQLGDRQFNLTARYARGMANVAREVDDQPFTEAPFPDEAQTQTWSLLLRMGL